jgi:hypothetical protein
MNTQLESLFQKEMSRKEFIATLGFGIASVMGFSTIIRLLTGKSADAHLRQRTSSSFGYGSSAYGGGKESN